MVRLCPGRPLNPTTAGETVCLARTMSNRLSKPRHLIDTRVAPIIVSPSRTLVLLSDAMPRGKGGGREVSRWPLSILSHRASR
jgi:hypothetical protein